MKLTLDMAKQVKATRKALGMTQAQWAQKLEVSVPTVIGIERAQKSFIRKSTWSKIFDGVVMVSGDLVKGPPVQAAKEPTEPLVKDDKAYLTPEEKKVVLKVLVKLLGL